MLFRSALVKRYTDQLETELSVEIGTTVKPLDSRRLVVREAEAAIGDLIADAIRDATGAEVGLVNGGGIRGDRLYPAGTKLTRRDALTELPFNNVTVMIELKGSDLLAALENGVSRITDRGGRFPQVSGLCFAYDPAKPAMQRVLEREFGGMNDALYRLATLSGEGRFAELAHRFDHERIYAPLAADRKSTRLNSSHSQQSRMPSSA